MSLGHWHGVNRGLFRCIGVEVAYHWNARVRRAERERLTTVAVRLWEPLTVAFAESVIVAVELLMAWIVVPDGTPVPVTTSPTISPVVLLTPVTDSDPLVSVPTKATLP